MSFVPNKKQAQQIHARRRAERRYEVKLTKDGRRDVINRIREGLVEQREQRREDRGLTRMASNVTASSANYLGNQSNRISEWEVPYEGKNLHVLYDHKRDTLITCLPPIEGEIEGDEDDGNV